MNQKDLRTPFEGAILGERFPRLRELDEQDADELYKILAAAPESASNGPAIFKHVRRLIKDLCNPEQRTQRAFRQREALLHDGRTLNGSEYIANDLVYYESSLSEQ
jgi:hypothetical protein